MLTLGRRGSDFKLVESKSRFVWWLIGGLTTIIFFAITAFVGFTTQSITQNRADISELKAIAAGQAVDLQYIRASVDKINSRLDSRGKK